MVEMKVIKVPLSNQGLDELLKKIKNLKKELSEADERIVKKLSDYTEQEIENNLSNTEFKDGNNDVHVFKEIDNKKAKIGMRGSQVLYDEFGTGTQGEQSPHPIKENFGLAGYNTGRKIRRASVKVNERTGIPIGSKYWTYKNKAGETIYTTGIPAGKQVFNAAQSLKNKKMEIVKQEVSDVLSKL